MFMFAKLLKIAGACVLSFFLWLPVAAHALPAAYTSETVTETLSAGITYEKQTRFTTAGWYAIHILRADLTNPNVKLGALVNTNGTGKLAPLMDMAGQAGAVAAVNGSFFTWLSGGLGETLGMTIKDGRLLTATSDINNGGGYFATLFSHDGQTAGIDFWLAPSIRLDRDDGLGINIQFYNEPFNGGAEFFYMDRSVSNTSVGSSRYSDVVEMVVDGGYVTEIRTGQGAVAIPVNGFVVSTRAAGGEMIKQRFPLGSHVTLKISAAVDWQNMQTAVTGAEILLKNGAPPATYSFNNNGAFSSRQPRTAAGITSDGRYLILVAVDGRQNASLGVTQAELSALMLELGAYQALGFDGGGSTTLVYRQPGTTALSVGNAPSGGSQRSIVNGVGLFSTAPPGSLSQLLLNQNSGKVFSGTTLALYLKGLDENGNPLSLDGMNVSWSVSGVEGSFEGNIFRASGEGQGQITANLNGLTATVPVTVLSPPVQLSVTQEKIFLNSGDVRTLTLTGRNRDGYSAAIRAQDLTTTLSGAIGSIAGSDFTAAGHGIGYITFSLNDLRAYTAVSVKNESDNTLIVEDFESQRLSYAGSHPSVNGIYKLDTTVTRREDTSGRMVYIFDEGTGTREAVLKFGEAINVPADRERVGIWVFAPSAVGDGQFKLRFVDGKGSRQDITLADTINWEGWRYLEAKLDFTPPSKLTEIVYSRTQGAPEAGEFYLDNLLFAKTIAQPPIPAGYLPKTLRAKDTAETSLNEGYGEAVTIAMIAQPRELDAEKSGDAQALNALKSLDTRVNGWILTGNSAHKLTDELTKPAAMPYEGHRALDIGTSRLLQLDISKGGMRLSHASQWTWLLGQLDSFSGDNLFICLTNSLSYFKDPLEAALLEKKLSQFAQRTGKNVTMVYLGTEDFGYVKDGVRYICNKGIPSTEITGSFNYVRFTIKGASLTYEFVPLF
jgi:exopolysaccharide biosynthesis protein